MGAVITVANSVGVPVTSANMTVLGSTETLDEFLEEVTPRGLMHSFYVTDQGGLNITWSHTEVFLGGTVFNLAARTTNYALTDDSVNYLYADLDGVIKVKTTALAYPELLLARIYTYNGDVEYLLTELGIFEIATGNHEFLDDTHDAAVISGLFLEIDIDGTNANDYIINVGEYFLYMHDRITVPSTLYSAGFGHGDSNVKAYYHDAASAWITKQLNGIEFGKWDKDDGDADVDATSPGKWYVGWIVLEGTGEIEYVYPQVEHNNEKQALREEFVYPPNHEGYVVPLAKFVFVHGEVAFTTNAYFIDMRPMMVIA